ncbi:serine hydrolase domain-containing protein [Actinomadura rubrisoli]|uniref:serine hydrolase domain-containing protein n=1 Tax=Actinomadura rubrisoli TaxID=2530368 RepID=UPI001A9EDA95|nr:serine hydrolase domain-containing protein [Actinomadura rubrisoli]
MPGDLLPGGKFDRYLADQAAHGKFSGTVLLAHRGRTVLARAHGMADEKRAIPNRRDTLFNLASVTKTFTAVAVAQLVQQEKVALHETLGTYLEGFPDEIAKTVTVHQVLTHTSGLGDYSQAPEFLDGLKKWKSAAEVMNGVMDIIRHAKLNFTPGTKFVYGNSNYHVLGALVERVSGLSYYDYVRRHVFARARMGSSDFYTGPQARTDPRIAHPYWTTPSGKREDFSTSEYFGFIGGPADGAYANLPDLLRYATALRTGALMAPAYSELFTTGKVPLSPTDPPPAPGQVRFYGYGFRNTILNGQLVFGHSGGRTGGATNLDIYPGLDWVTVILGNQDTSIDSLVQLARRLITTG